MNILKYLAIALLVIGEITVLILALKSKKALRLLFLNALMGLALLLILYFTKGYSGIDITINPYTVLGSTFLGIPAVIGFLFLNLLI